MQKHAWRITTCIALTAVCLIAPGCGELRSPTGPAPSMPTGPQSESAGEATFAVGPELAALRQATSQFHDISAAHAAGYTTENEPCVSSPAGAMGIHAPNLALSSDPTLDPLRPEVLLYIPGPNGQFRLTGVEYFQAVLLRDLETQQVAPRFEPTPWDPAKYEVVNPQPQLFGHTFHLSPPPVPHVPWHWALHVWVWAHNPSGMFADWNPSLQCN